jgi:hypothetical protein
MAQNVPNVLCGLLALCGIFFVLALVVGRRGDVDVVLMRGIHVGCCFGNDFECYSGIVLGMAQGFDQGESECEIEDRAEEEFWRLFDRVFDEEFEEAFEERFEDACDNLLRDEFEKALVGFVG